MCRISTGQKRSLRLAHKALYFSETILLFALASFVLVVFILQELSNVSITFPLEGFQRDTDDMRVSSGGIASSILQLVAW